MRWKHRPEGSNWGEFGADDQLGRLNLIDDACRLRAAREIRSGKSFCLSLPLDVPETGFSELRKRPVQHFAQRANGQVNVNYPLRNEDPRYTDIVSDDQFTISTQYSTQWDALAHVGSAFDVEGDGIPRPVYYNGYRAGTDVVSPRDDSGLAGAHALSVDVMAQHTMQGRGIMIDLAGRVGNRELLVGFAQVAAIVDEEKITVGSGDILCFHTGFGDALARSTHDKSVDVDPRRYPSLDGRDARLCDWIDKSGVAAIAADNVAVEAYPNIGPAQSKPCAGLPLHEHCLFKLGIPLGELWYLTELRNWLKENSRNRFFLTCPPLRLPRAFGSPVTPVATV